MGGTKAAALLLLLKFHVLARPLAAILDAAFQRGILPDDVKSSLVTPFFKKGDKCDPANYPPIAVGEPLCRLYAAILNRRIVSWAEEVGLRAPCRAGFRPRMSTEHQLFALRHFIDKARFQKQPLFAALLTLERPMTACSTLSSGRPYSAREFMARCLQPYSHCIVELQ